MFLKIGINCLVGGAGSGKSTIIEFLRFGLDQVSSNSDIRNDCLGNSRTGGDWC